uniref:glucuronosyltransferase n=1 Tax=Globodera rostochiensis TaxID=31243 RepID=A0A914H5C1_GLORO
MNLANFLTEECGHKVHMLVPIRDENGKLSDKDVEARLNIRYFSAENHTVPQKVKVKQDTVLPIDNIFLEIISDLALMDKLKAEKFDVGISEAFFLTEYSLAIFHILQIPATIATLTQPMWPIHLYLLGTLSKMKADNLLASIGVPTIPKLVNKITRNLHGDKLVEKVQEFWELCVTQTLESTKGHINQNTSLNNLMLNNGTARGIILISFGTNVDTDEPEHTQLFEAVIGTAENFPDILFILKLSKGHGLPIKRDNVVTATWVNQKEILGHPKTKAFVSHCGMNSVYESTFNGVPMVCVPFFGDQYYNSESLVRQHIALVVEREQDTDTIKKQLTVALTKTLGLEKSDGSEEHIDLDRVKSIGAAIRDNNVGKTICEAMKVIENEMNEKH